MKFNVSLAAFLMLLVCVSASAQVHPPMTETVPIQVVVGPDDPFEQFFENHFDPDLPKELWFEGIARAEDDPTGPDGSILFVVFDWLDLSGEIQFSTPFQLVVPVNDPQPFHFHWLIPFCPEVVSLHMNVEGAPVIVIGEFTHDCVPEPSSMVLMGLAALGVVGLVVRRRRRR